ncbi:uncharacterized protein BJ212DRAFT_1296451 [Suillus subaureus]|uniref:Uncharacterized protein n=1 Tax=Suillus subaureus TaxID=48587 RepID=A0A9P7JIE4_9AGAM|nr:uncharacterized protein BJ212DRAFT_1296451 [Suillus subaureus]KAG1823934.1 hypothetical protein BJ212DRAFT_1296451 [Suillus subaureus]
MPLGIMVSICALMHFHYLMQSPHIDNDNLAHISAALDEFHVNKHAIITAGVHQGKGSTAIDNWHIPKIELMQSIVPSIHSSGMIGQWSADATEHAHIMEVKDPARSTNNNNYDLQIYVTELQVPLHKIHYWDDRLHRKFTTTGKNDLVHLYDKDQCQWNWPLPKSYHDQVEQWLLTGNGSLASGDGQEQSVMASVESESGGRGSLSGSLPLEEEPTSGSQPVDNDNNTPLPLFEGVFVMFFNVICFTLAQKVPKIVQETNPVPCLWSAGNATCHVKDEEVA